ncbi:MAG TPA: DUF1054 family protein [Anaeromyxobacteraceae bacterium]|nr:DUF1054 family protein [Anaeromyxobacteraceae bacterium]
MAGLGIGPDQFAVFRIADPEERADAIEARLAPALSRVAEVVVAGLSRVAAVPLLVHPGKLVRRRDVAPEEGFVAFCASDKGYHKVPYLALVVTREQLHARVAVRGGADRDGVMRRALQREASNLARKGKPFRKLRSYASWDYEELPEIAPAHSTAFWEELADALAPEANAGPGIDVGTAWPAEEARNLALGDVLGAFRDLAPLYKLLANAR